MKLMERVKATMRDKSYSLRTKKTYCYWIRFNIRFQNLRHTALSLPLHLPQPPPTLRSIQLDGVPVISG